MTTRINTIVVTGGMGVIGSALVNQLAKVGWHAKVLDIAAEPTSANFGDIRQSDAVRTALESAVGIIHLAAVSRVGWGEEDPERCWSINVDGTQTVVTAAASSSRKPWVLFASSREVYGNPLRLPVVEDDPVSPVNTYGRSKAEGEKIIAAARVAGLKAACVRLPSVYGATNDIVDRVVPALALGALNDMPLRITGAGQLCDFLHIADVVDGILAIAKRLDAGRRDLPMIQLASGRGTSLGELARLVKRLARSRSEIVEDPARSFDVRGFVGDPARARQVLNWVPSITLEDGLAQLITDFETKLAKDRCPHLTNDRVLGPPKAPQDRAAGPSSR